MCKTVHYIRVPHILQFTTYMALLINLYINKVSITSVIISNTMCDVRDLNYSCNQINNKYERIRKPLACILSQFEKDYSMLTHLCFLCFDLPKYVPNNYHFFTI